VIFGFLSRDGTEQNEYWRYGGFDMRRGSHSRLQLTAVAFTRVHKEISSQNNFLNSI
jgi:hypothetical protein